MPKPIDDTDMLVTLAEDIVAGRAETPTGAMRLHGVERGSGQERRLLKKWAVHGDVLRAAYAAGLWAGRSEDEYIRGFNAGLQAERDAREAAMIAGTSALAQPDTAPAGGTMTPGMFYEAPPQTRRPSLWARMIGVAG